VLHNARGILHETKNGFYEVVPTSLGGLNFDGKVDICHAMILVNSFDAKPTDPR
jgi:hypothetical protein